MNDDEFLVYKVNDFKPLEKKEKISFKKGEKVVNIEEYKNIKNSNRDIELFIMKNEQWQPLEILEKSNINFCKIMCWA